jgi:hypothetical protein
MRSLRAFLLTAVLLAICAPAAGATTFCVPAFHAACPAGGGRVAQASLQTALKTSGDDGTPDRVVLAAGTFAEPDTIDLDSGDNDDLEIAGAGPAASVITTTAAGNIFVVNFSSARDITMRDVSIRVPAAFPDGQGSALQADDSTLEDVRIESLNPGSDGINAIGDVTVRRTRIFASGSGSIGEGVRTSNADSGLLTVTDSAIEDASWGLSGSAVDQDLEVRRTRVEADAYCLRLSGGQAALVENSICRFTGDGEPISLSGDANGGPVSATLRHMTIAGTAVDPSDPAIVVTVQDESGAHAAQAIVSDTVVTGFGTGFARTAPSSASKGNALITVRYSHLPLSGTGVGDGSVTLLSNLNAAGADPLLDADLRPLSGSPVVDKGDPATAGLPTSDIAGAVRPSDGDGDGTARRDMGAYERPAPTSSPDPVDPGTPPASPAGPVPAAATSVPGPAVTPPALPARDVTAPTISRLRFGRRVSARRGGTVTFTLSETANVEVTFRPGLKKAVRLKRRGRSGVNRLTIGKRKLRAQRQQVTVVAVDAAGNRSKPLRTRLTVTR